MIFAIRLADALSRLGFPIMVHLPPLRADLCCRALSARPLHLSQSCSRRTSGSVRDDIHLLIVLFSVRLVTGS
jgi:hypothetical protein